MFEKFERDTIQLTKKNGDVFGQLKAGIQRKMILFSHTTIPIESGDIISRQLPSGLEEKFVVIDPGYTEGLGSIKPHYQIKYQKEGDKVGINNNTTIYNVTGQNSRVNIDSNDYSTNIVNNAPEQLFDAMREVLLSQIQNESEKQQLITLTEKMRSSQGTNEFIISYKEFMAVAANHMGVLLPFLPALASLLT